MKHVSRRLAFFAFAAVTSPAFSAWVDQGYRYNHAKAACADEGGTAGYNDTFIGVCGGLAGFRFTTMNLTEAKLMGADLGPSDLHRESAHGDNVIFDYADLRGVRAMHTRFVNSSFKAVNFERADFTGAHFNVRGRVRPVLFTKANLREARFRDTYFFQADFTGADLRGTDFRNAAFEGKTEWKGAAFDDKTRLPFSGRVAIDLGMKYSPSTLPLDPPDAFEPRFPRLTPPVFDRGACGVGMPLTAAIADCAKIYPEESQRAILRTQGEVVWSLARLSSDGRSAWNDDGWGATWLDEGEQPYPARRASEACAEGFEVPTRKDFGEAADRGLTRILPGMARNAGAFWTADSVNPQYDEHFYFFDSSSWASFPGWHEAGGRVVCVRRD